MHILLIAALGIIVGSVEMDWSWLAAIPIVALVFWQPRRRSLDELMAHPARAGWRWDKLNPRNWKRLAK